MKRSLVSLVGAVTLCAFPLTSLAREPVADLTQLEPWAMENPDKASPDKYVGIYIDIAKEVEKRAGLKITTRVTPYARIENDLQEGSADFSFLVWSEERASYASRGAEVTKMDFGVRAVAGVPLKTYDDLKGVSVSVTRGPKLDPKFDADASLKKELDTDYSTGVRKAEAGRVQAVAGSIPAINRIIRHASLDAKFQDTLVLRSVTIAVQYSKKASDPALQAKVDAAVSALVADGTAKKIIDAWMNK
jgi:polar amino acid transport system substrate-binding protein